MQTQTAATEPAAAPGDKIAPLGPHDRIWFHAPLDIRQVKRAMKAARVLMMNRNGSFGSLAPCCRMVARKGQHRVDVLATDGHRMMVFLVDAVRHRQDKLFDEAIPFDAVRAIVNGKNVELRLECPEHEGPVRLSWGEVAGPWFEFKPGLAFEQRSFYRIANDDAGAEYITAIDVDRPKALAALRDMPAQNLNAHGRSVCRVTIGHSGIKVWATNASMVGPDYAPDAVIPATVVNCPHEPVVFAMTRHYLTDTLRMMTTKTLDIAFADPTKALRFTSTDHRETVIVMPSSF